MKDHDLIARELLAPLVGRYDATLEDRRRVREKLRARIAGSAGASNAGASAPATNISGVFVKVAAVSALVALGVVAYETYETYGTHEAGHSEPAPIAEPRAVPNAAASASIARSAVPPPHAALPPHDDVPSVAVELLPPVALADRALSAPPQGPRGRAQVRTNDEPEEEDDLEKETRLLAEAAQASREGDVGRALALLDEHAKQFSRGVLADERVVAKILALCRVGRREEARDVARAFLAARAPSPLTRRVEVSCVGSDAPASETP